MTIPRNPTESFEERVADATVLVVFRHTLCLTGGGPSLPFLWYEFSRLPVSEGHEATMLHYSVYTCPTGSQSSDAIRFPATLSMSILCFFDV